MADNALHAGPNVVTEKARICHVNGCKICLCFHAHSLVDEQRRGNASLLLRDHFNSPRALEEASGSLDALVRGLATQASQQVDTYLVEDLTNLMFRDATELGVDALSLAVQRGRDHGLPGYNQYRKLCGLPLAKSFDDFSDAMPRQVALKLAAVYAHPDDVDVLVGGMAERAWEGSLVGPTLRCIVSEQMLRSRKADRYFYDNADQPHPFTRGKHRIATMTST